MLLIVRYLLIPALLLVWVYCVFDVIRSEPERVRYLHKLVWLILVLVFFPIGALAWLMLGRPVPIGSRLIPPPRTGSRAPDDSPEFLAKLDDEIKRRRRADRLRKPPDDIDPDTVDDEIQRLEKEFEAEAGGEGTGEDEEKA